MPYVDRYAMPFSAADATPLMLAFAADYADGRRCRLAADAAMPLSLAIPIFSSSSAFQQDAYERGRERFQLSTPLRRSGYDRLDMSPA